MIMKSSPCISVICESMFPYDSSSSFIFQQFGLGGDPQASRGHDQSKVLTMQKIEDREITVIFDADKHTAMLWNFRPQQRKVKVCYVNNVLDSIFGGWFTFVKIIVLCFMIPVHLLSFSWKNYVLSAWYQHSWYISEQIGLLSLSLFSVRSFLNNCLQNLSQK